MTSNDPDNFELLEEFEWRVVEHPYQKDMENMIEPEGWPETPPKYYLPVKPQDIRVIVFPDQETHSAALEIPEIKGTIGIARPIVMTLDQCRNS